MPALHPLVLLRFHSVSERLLCNNRDILDSESDSEAESEDYVACPSDVAPQSDENERAREAKRKANIMAA